MAEIKRYFATAKITPVDRGTAAFEQAGRRIGGFAEQAAQGDRILGADIGKLWQEQKFGLDLLHAESHGGGGSLGRGNAHDALDFGKPFGSGATLGAGGQNESNPTGEGRSYNDTYNASAARDIGEGAASLPSLVTKLINGQGLTDQQYQQMGMSRGGAQAMFNARNQGGMVGVYGKNPNPGISDEEAAKAGFNVDSEDQNPQYIVNNGPDVKGGPRHGDWVPDYPSRAWGGNQFGPQIEAYDNRGMGIGSNVQGGSPLDPSSPNYAGGHIADVSQTQGAQTWQNVRETVQNAGSYDPENGVNLMPNNYAGAVNNAPTPDPNPTSSGEAQEPTNALQ